MLKIIMLLSLTLISSCASVKADWKREDVSMGEWKWRYCKQDKDGSELHNKGFCRISKLCRKVLFVKKCKNDPHFCAWGDIACLEKYDWPEVRKGGKP